MYHDIEQKRNGRTQDQNAWRQRVVDALAKAGLAKEADSFATCQDEDTIKFYHTCSQNPEHVARAIAHTCHLRICPECARRESARLKARYYEPIRKIVKTYRKDRALRHIVVTTRFHLQDGDIRERLRESFEKLAQLFDLLLPANWRKMNIGYLAGAEFGEEGNRLHFHILYYGPFIHYTDMALVWYILTGNTALPYLRYVDGKKYTLDEAVNELVKYCTKLSILDVELMPALLEAVRGTRRVRAQGIFYRLPHPDKEPCTCPECSAPMEMWSRAKYEAWKESQLQQKRSELLSDLRSILDLKLGNKFLFSPRPPDAQGDEKISFAYQEPPPLDLTALEPPPPSWDYEN